MSLALQKAECLDLQLQGQLPQIAEFDFLGDNFEWWNDWNKRSGDQIAAAVSEWLALPVVAAASLTSQFFPAGSWSEVFQELLLTCLHHAHFWEKLHNWKAKIDARIPQAEHETAQARQSMNSSYSHIQKGPQIDVRCSGTEMTQVLEAVSAQLKRKKLEPWHEVIGSQIV